MFNRGDRVFAVDGDCWWDEGDEGTCVRVEDGLVLVLFDPKEGAELTCNGDREWFANFDDVEVIEAGFQVGDRVRVLPDEDSIWYASGDAGTVLEVEEDAFIEVLFDPKEGAELTMNETRDWFVFPHQLVKV